MTARELWARFYRALRCETTTRGDFDAYRPLISPRPCGILNTAAQIRRKGPASYARAKRTVLYARAIRLAQVTE